MALAIPQAKDDDGLVQGDGSRVVEKSYLRYVLKTKSTWFVDMGHEKIEEELLSPGFHPEQLEG